MEEDGLKFTGKKVIKQSDTCWLACGRCAKTAMVILQVPTSLKQLQNIYEPEGLEIHGEPC